MFFHAAPKLIDIKEEEKQKTDPDQQLINDIGTALRFVEEDYGGTLASLQSLLASGEITFDLLWAIFPPQELIVAMEHGVLRQPQALPLLSSDYGTRENGQRYFWAKGSVITHDGEDFGKGDFTTVINAFEGARKVSSLAFYPLKFHHEEAALRERLIARGKKYVELLQAPTCRDYPLHYAIGESLLALQRDDKDPEKINVCVHHRAEPDFC